jgi:hypothetical protein
VEQKYKGKISEHMMQYEELRSLAVIHFQKIGYLETVIDDLTSQLAEMTHKKDVLELKLSQKEK